MFDNVSCRNPEGKSRANPGPRFFSDISTSLHLLIILITCPTTTGGHGGHDVRKNRNSKVQTEKQCSGFYSGFGFVTGGLHNAINNEINTLN